VLAYDVSGLRRRGLLEVPIHLIPPLNHILSEQLLGLGRLPVMPGFLRLSSLLRGLPLSQVNLVHLVGEAP
jgi:hypothetical protein